MADSQSGAYVSTDIPSYFAISSVSHRLSCKSQDLISWLLSYTLHVIQFVGCVERSEPLPATFAATTLIETGALAYGIASRKGGYLGTVRKYLSNGRIEEVTRSLQQAILEDNNTQVQQALENGAGINNEMKETDTIFMPLLCSNF